MSQTETPPEPGALAALTEAAARGRTLSTRPNIAAGQVRMWTGSVRSPLRKVFGAESQILTLWPAADAPFSAERALETLIERIARLEQLTHSVSAAASSALVPALGKRVFIGHGRSTLWRELKDFLVDRLALPWEEFNREAVAGIATSERLMQMLDGSSFALLVLTAEDEHADNTIHARENVVHEVGLFQGRLGMRKAIVLMEEGCQVFSNIHGLSYIPFPKGRISAAFEEIRRVLERERIVEI